MLEDNQLPDATIVASLDILLTSAGATQIPKMLGSNIKIMATKSMAIKVMVVVMVMVIGRPMVWPMPWIPMSSLGIWLVFLKGIDLGYPVIIFIGLISHKTVF